MAREMNLSKFLPSDEPTSEEERAYYESGWFDDQLNYHHYAEDCPLDSCFNVYFSWEWSGIPEIVAYAKKLGIPIPDGTVDFSKTF